AGRSEQQLRGAEARGRGRDLRRAHALRRPVSRPGDDRSGEGVGHRRRAEQLTDLAFPLAGPRFGCAGRFSFVRRALTVSVDTTSGLGAAAVLVERLLQLPALVRPGPVGRRGADLLLYPARVTLG